MDMLLNVPPLDLHIEFEVGRSYHRLRSTLSGKLYPPPTRGHHKAAKEIFEKARLDETIPDFCEIRLGKRSYKVKASSFNRGKPYEDVNRLRIFTDAR